MAAAALLLARTVYAFNWYNIGGVLPALGRDLPATTFELGVVLGAFLLGAAVFQLPAGVASLRWGNRAVSIFALFLMGSFAFASAFSPNWYVLAGLRFGAGAGAAFFFAPALGLVTSYFPVGTRGPIIGLYNAGFAVGSAVGLFGGALVGAAFGWPATLIVGGAGLLAMAVVAPFALPRTEAVSEHRGLRPLWDAATPVLRSRSIWALSLSTSGLWAAFFIVPQYFVAFASQAHSAWPIALAAALPTVMIILEVPGGPVGGWLGERTGEMKGLLLLWGATTGVAVFFIPLVSILGLVPLFVLLGFADGVVFAVLYLLPSYLPESRGETLALGLAFLNSIQIFLGSGLAIAFGYLAGTIGYTGAWWFAGAVALGPLPLLAWVSGRRGPTRAPAVLPPSAPRAVRAPNRPG